MKCPWRRRIQSAAALAMLMALPALAGEFELKLAPESGYFGSSGGADASRNYNLFSGLATVGYRFRQLSQHGQVQVRFRPEHYGVKSATTILHWNALAEYYRQWGSTQWGVTAQQRRLNFYRPSRRLFADITQVTLNGQWQDTGPWSTEIQVTHFIRTLSGDTRHSLQTPFAVFRARYRKTDRIAMSMGFYMERFKFHVPYRRQSPKTNRGWGIGPELNLEYRGDQIVNLNYLAVFRQSDVITDDSHEHRLSLLIGRTIGEKYSVFLFADYTFRQLDNRNDELRDLYYHSSNTESRFYLKLGYDLTRSLEAFVKAGYVRYELYDFNSDFSGAHVTAGLSAEL